MQVYFSLLRVPSWVKNFFLLAPLIFSFNLLNASLYFPLLAAFFSFCFISSAVYVFNDIADVESDRLHPRKKIRPLASGQVSLTTATGIGIILLIASLGIGYFVKSTLFYGALLSYLVINVAYILKLRKISLVDCFCIASGFVIRVLAGCYAIGVAPSDWIIVVTFFLALFLAFSKRKTELLQLGEHSAQHRSSLSVYSVKMLDVFIYICAAICITAYLLYTLTSSSVPHPFHTQLKYSAFFVVFGLFRYIQIIETGNRPEGDPTYLVYKDGLLQLTIVLWLAYAIYVIYG